MRKLLLFLVLFISAELQAQDYRITIDDLLKEGSGDVTMTDTILCAERGHISGGLVFTTDMYCPPYVEDTDTTSVLVYPSCNYINYNCQRCGQYIHEKEKERRVIICRKN